jgi:hypothetical protein
MKILKGIKKSQFINNYCNQHKEKKFLLIDTIDNSYPFESENLLLFKSNSNKWTRDIKEADKELSEDVIFILFTNDDINNIEIYRDHLESFNREVILTIKGNWEAVMDGIVDYKDK